MSNNSKFEMDFIFDFLPSLSSLPRDIFESLANKMQQTLKDHEFINGIFVLSTSNEQPLIYSKSIKDFQTITQVAELINSFDITTLLRDLSSRGYHGVEIITFPEFSLGLMKLTDTDVFAVLITATNQILQKLEVEEVVYEIKNRLFDDTTVDKMQSIPFPDEKNDNDVNQLPIPPVNNG